MKSSEPGPPSLACPLCQEEGEAKLAVAGYDILECRQCRHRYLPQPLPLEHTESTFEDDYFEGGGAGYPDYLKEGRILQKRGEWFAEKIRKHLVDPSPSIFDVGAAAGFVLKGFEEKGFRPSGIEPNARMATLSLLDGPLA